MTAAKQISEIRRRNMPGETADARAQRLAVEAELIAEARAGAAKGETVSDDQVNAWIDSLGTDHELPVPQSGR